MIFILKSIFFAQKKSHFRENCFRLVEMAGTAPASNRANRVILLIIGIFEKIFRQEKSQKTENQNF